MAKKWTMTENSRKVFDYLKAAGAGVKFTCKQVQNALGFDKPGYVTGSVTSLVNKGYAVRFVETVTDEDGKETEVKYFALTDEGAAYDPDAVVDEDE